MAKPDPNLGIPANFPEQTFRNAIHFAMQMGTNPLLDKDGKLERAPTFVIPGDGWSYLDQDGHVIWAEGDPLAGKPRTDQDGQPLDPDIEVVEDPDTEITRDCAIEVTRADADELPVGNFRPTKVVVTLLDDDYLAVKDARRLLYNGDEYIFGYEPESVGLFEVGVYTLIFYALDES